MHSKVVFVLFCIATVALAEITFVGNVSLNVESKNDWTFRKTSLTVLPLLHDAWYTSAEVQESTGEISGDYIVGGVHGGGLLTYPYVYLGYAAESISFNGSLSSIDITAAESFIGAAFISVTEKDSTGNVVVTYDLADILVSWSVVQYSTSGSLKYVTFEGNKTGLINLEPVTYSASFTFIISDTVGVVSLAGAIVTPKVLETIVQINSWPYQSSTNTLTLKSVVATGSANVNKNIFLAGSGNNQVYFQVNDTAVINGKNGQVTITNEASATSDITVGELEAWVEAKFGSSATVQTFYSTFTANAASITYDPTMGSGTPVSQQQGSSSSATNNYSTSVVVFVFAVVCAFVALF